MQTLRLTADELVQRFGQYGAAVRGIDTVVRYLVITDPATMVLEGDAVRVEVDDPDGALWAAAGQALDLNRRHRRIDETVADVTVAELVRGYERQIPKPASNPMLLQFDDES
jgi:hypothetical protein